MKIAVYTISKNEEQFIERWFNSCKQADYVLVVDTGSTDDTVEKLSKLARHNKNLHYSRVNITPWRFDDARQFSLMSLPNDIDICIALDMDEILTKDWKHTVLSEWEPDLDRLRYNYVWSWVDGKPGLTYYADKIHARHGLRWVNPVHEVLQKDLRLGNEKQKYTSETLIEHYPDHTKSRANYLELLELAVKENPLNDRNTHYYARDLMFAGRYLEAIGYFNKHLQLETATWNSERAASMRYLGDCYWALGDYNQALCWFISASHEAPNEREPWVSLAQAYRALGRWAECNTACKKALKITERPNNYINHPIAWSDWPEQMLKESRKHMENKNAT